MDMQKADITTIKDILENNYLQGIYTGDLARLRQIYHPGTLLFGDVKGQRYAKTLQQYFDDVAQRQSPKDADKTFEGNIISVKAVNSIAIAELTVKMYDFNYHEFLSFHKIDGKWYIVNKMISDIQQ